MLKANVTLVEHTYYSSLLEVLFAFGSENGRKT